MQKYKNSMLLLVIAVLLAIFISPFASSSPDGLEWVAGIKGFLSKAEESVFWKFSIMPDYKILFITKEGLSTSIAGLLGTLVCFATAIVFFRRLGKRTNDDDVR